MGQLTVTSGTGSGEYAAEATVTITANAAPAGQVFYRWTCSDSAIFASAYNPTTTITMPTKNTTVTATYRSAVNPTPGGGGGGDYTSSTPSTTITTTNNEDGSTTKTTTNADGSRIAVTTAQDGCTATVKTDAQGSTVSAEAAPSAKAISDAAAKGEAVTLPVEVKATTSAESAAEVKVTLPASVSAENPAKVEIPVENLTVGTVAVIVHEDGTEEIVKTSTTSEAGVVLTLDSSATVKIVDNTKSFGDVTGGEWYTDNVAWAASHEVMNGMGDGTFAPNAPTTQGMMEQMLFNIDGNALVAPAEGEAWWAAADDWAESNGVTSGVASHDPAAPATREADVLMMFSYAKSKGYDTSARADLSRFSDADSVSVEARDAMAWAVAVGIINGSTDENGNVILDAQGTATRAQIAAITQRFCEKVTK